MQKDLSFILLALAGVVFFTLIIFTLRARLSRRYQRTSDLDGLDDFRADLMSDEFELIIKDKSSACLSESDELEIITSLHTAKKQSSNTLSEQQRITSKKSQPTEKKPPNIIAISILPLKGQKFIGCELHQALLATGFHYGEMSIFHRHECLSGEGKVLFSLAQATEPGIFHINTMDSDSYCGLTLFMQLSGPEHNLKSFSLMLQAAAQLADNLKGTVRDTRGQLMQQSMVDQFRQTVAYHANRSKIPAR